MQATLLSGDKLVRISGWKLQFDLRCLLRTFGEPIRRNCFIPAMAVPGMPRFGKETPDS